MSQASVGLISTSINIESRTHARIDLVIDHKLTSILRPIHDCSLILDPVQVDGFIAAKSLYNMQYPFEMWVLAKQILLSGNALWR